MNVSVRKQELKRIEQENAKMALRLLGTKGVVAKKKDVLADFKHH